MRTSPHGLHMVINSFLTQVAALNEELRAARDSAATSAARAIAASAVIKALALASAVSDDPVSPAAQKLRDGTGFSSVGATNPFSPTMSVDCAACFPASDISSMIEEARGSHPGGGDLPLASHQLSHHHHHHLNLTASSSRLSFVEAASSRASSSGGSLGGDGVVVLAISGPMDLLSSQVHCMDYHGHDFELDVPSLRTQSMNNLGLV